MASGDRVIKNVLNDFKTVPASSENEEQSSNQNGGWNPLEILRRRRQGLAIKDDSPLSAGPPDVKKTIVKALMYSPGRKPLNLSEVADFVRRYNTLIHCVSSDEMIYKALFELCSENVVHRVCNSCDNFDLA